MKTAISIPDDLFGQADEFARKTGKSRSQVFREAITEYLLRRDSRHITMVMDEALGQIDQQPDPWLADVGRRALERTEW